MQVAILHCPSKCVCHDMQINMPVIYKYVPLCCYGIECTIKNCDFQNIESAASLHILWSPISEFQADQFTPWHYIVPGYSRVAKYFIWILIPFCAFGHGTHVHIPVPLKHFALLCPECRLMDWVSFNSFSLSCPECRLLQGCRLSFLGYLPWVSFITWVSSIRESRVC